MSPPSTPPAGIGEKTPLQQAQDLAYDAWEANTPLKAARLARRALKTSGECADAYNVLARAEAHTPKEQLDLYEKGVEAAQRALGEEQMEELEGRYWGVVETRPYMRALEGKARCLRQMEQTDEAIEVCEAMLELNPNDNQGMRDLLLALYLEEDQFDDVEELLSTYEMDASATFSWTRVLLAHLTEGPDAAEEKLPDALDANEHVPDLLSTKRDRLDEPEPFYAIGDESEALHYVIDHRDAWEAHPAALAWLRNAIGDIIEP